MGHKIKELAAASGRNPGLGMVSGMRIGWFNAEEVDFGGLQARGIGFRGPPVGDLRKLLPERGVLLAFLHK